MPHFITLEKAKKMTKMFRDNRQLPPLDQLRDRLPISQTFDRKALEQILSQPGCQKIRIYMGMDEGLKFHNIIVGVDADDKDMLPLSDAGTTEEGEVREGETVIVNEAVTCPPVCSPPSDLNP